MFNHILGKRQIIVIKWNRKIFFLTKNDHYINNVDKYNSEVNASHVLKIATSKMTAEVDPLASLINFQ